MIWGAADPSSDIYLSASVSVAKALVFRQKGAESKSEGDVQGIELAVNILEKQLKGLDDMEAWTSTIQSNGGKIAKEIAKIRETAKVQIEQLRACLDALRPESEAI